MIKTDLIEIVRNGENSGTEFKRDDVEADKVAKELAALLNLRGGTLLLGVEDDGAVSGLTRSAKATEEWVMNLCRSNLQPAVIPFWEVIEWDAGRWIGVVRLPADAPDRPYKAKRGSAWVTFIRVGSTSREASREEEARLYQRAGLVRYETRPVPGSTLADFDLRRLRDHFGRVREWEPDTLPADEAAWVRDLVHTELMVTPDPGGPTCASVVGLLLFGASSRRFLPQVGAKLTAYPGTEKDYATVAEERLTAGPLVSLWSEDGTELLGRGLIDQVIDFVARHNPMEAWLEGGVRREKRAWPEGAIRESVVNAFVHRDWSMYGAEVTVDVYSNRLEVSSPGPLPNGVTVEGMRRGLGFARNPLLRDVLREHRYVDDRGLGVQRKIVRGMRDHNGTEPDLVAEESRFVVRLHKAPRRAGTQP